MTENCTTQSLKYYQVSWVKDYKIRSREIATISIRANSNLYCLRAESTVTRIITENPMYILLIILQTNKSMTILNKEKHKHNKNKKIISINNKVVLSTPMKVINNNIN
jgi:hypothetical protein